MACTTTATDWISRVTTCVSTTATTMAMIALGSGSPVGLMIVVSPVDRKENGMLIDLRDRTEDERDDHDHPERGPEPARG